MKKIWHWLIKYQPTHEQAKYILFASVGFCGGQVVLWLTYLLVYYLVNGHV